MRKFESENLSAVVVVVVERHLNAEAPSFITVQQTSTAAKMTSTMTSQVKQVTLNKGENAFSTSTIIPNGKDIASGSNMKLVPPSPPRTPVKTAANAKSLAKLDMMIAKNSDRSVYTASTVETETSNPEEENVWVAATKLIEEKLETDRSVHRERINKTVQKFREKRHKMKATLKTCQQENFQLVAERDKAIQSLHDEIRKSHKTLAAQRRALERNDRMQVSANRLRSRIEKLETERNGWLDERARMARLITDLQTKLQEPKQVQVPHKHSHRKHDKPYTHQKSLHSIPEDGADPLTEKAAKESTDSSLRKEQKKNRESLLASQLHDVNRKFDFQRKLLKMKNEELAHMAAENEALRKELDGLSKESRSHETLIPELQQELQMEREARKTTQAESIKLKSEVEKLQDLAGSCSRQLATQQIFVKSLKNRILESQSSQQKKFEEILKLCAQFEGKGSKAGTNMMPSKENPTSSPSRKKTAKVTLKKETGSSSREKSDKVLTTTEAELPSTRKSTKVPPQREKPSSPTGKELTDKFSELQNKHSDESS
jgi:hypothetical protein